MNIEFHERFADDILDAVGYYREQEPGLEYDFVDEVEQTIEKIKRDPKIYPAKFQDVRGLHLDRFKKYLIRYRYIDGTDTLRFLCVVHGSRHPRITRDRR